MADDGVLDDPVGASLRGRHAHLARRHGDALTYRADVATFSAVPRDPGGAAWDDLAALLGPGGFADLFSSPATPPATWRPVFTMDGVQLVGDAGGLGPLAPDADVVELGAADLPAMLGLVERTRPGPFRAATPAMGRFVGVRLGGRLVAMAGERLCPPGWTEISAVCTDPDVRGRGLAGRLVRDLAGAVLSRGERPFLHVVAGNPARGLYERLGFRVRREVVFRGFRVPEDVTERPARPAG